MLVTEVAGVYEVRGRRPEFLQIPKVVHSAINKLKFERPISHDLVDIPPLEGGAIFRIAPVVQSSPEGEYGCTSCWPVRDVAGAVDISAVPFSSARLGRNPNANWNHALV